MRRGDRPILRDLAIAVEITKQRNMTDQKIGKKNEDLRRLVYTITDGRLIENDGQRRDSLYDFAQNHEHR